MSVAKAPVTSLLCRSGCALSFPRLCSGTAPTQNRDDKLPAGQRAKQPSLEPVAPDTQTATSVFKAQADTSSVMRTKNLGDAAEVLAVASKVHQMRAVIRKPDTPSAVQRARVMVAAVQQAEIEAPPTTRARPDSLAALLDDGSATRQRPSSDQIAFMQQCRRQIIVQEGFLSYGSLQTALIQQFGEQRNWSRALVDACSALRRVLSSVEGAIDTALATHLVVTLRDVREMLMEHKEFQRVGSFEGLDIGALVHNRKVRTRFQPSPATLERGEVPDVTTMEVLAAIAEEMNPGGKLNYSSRADSAHSDHLKKKEAIGDILDDLAKRKGCEQGRDLCVFIAAEAFVVWMLSRSKTHAQRLEDAFKFYAVNTLGHEIDRYKKETLEREIAAYREVMEVAASQEELQAVKWWRAVQRAVCSTGVEPAIRLVRRLLLSLPEVWERRDRMRVARQSVAGQHSCDDEEEGNYIEQLVRDGGLEGKADSGIGALEVASVSSSADSQAACGVSGVIRIADREGGRAAVLKAGDRVVVSATRSLKKEHDSLASRAAWHREDKTVQTKLAPRIACYRKAMEINKKRRKLARKIKKQRENLAVASTEEFNSG
jgi:hypothetical protein